MENNRKLLQSERVTIVKDAIFCAVSKSDMQELSRSQQTQRQMKAHPSGPANNWRKGKEAKLMNNR